MKRNGQALTTQAENFLNNLGAAGALGLILDVDPIFAKFLEKECRLNIEAVKELSAYARAASMGLRHENGIITKENCELFLKENDSYSEEGSQNG